MADSKISDLSAATSLLATDEFVIASSGTTKKITAVNLAAALPGQEMAYAQITSSVNVTGTTEAGATTIVTAGAFTADGTSAYEIHFFTPSARPDSTTALNTLEVWLYQDGSSIGRLTATQVQASGVGFPIPMSLHRRLIPSSGSRTYSIRASVNTGTGNVGAGAGGSGVSVPTFIRITKAT